MNQILQPKVGGLALLSSSLVLFLSSCFYPNAANLPAAAPVESPIPEDQLAQPQEPTPTPETAQADQINYYQRAINRASSAVAIGQSAQSQDDWALAAGRWQQAIGLIHEGASG